MRDASRQVRCSFSDCNVSLIARVVTATVDQITADANIEVALLDALEVPVTETLEALDDYGIEAVDVGLDGRRISISVWLTQAVENIAQALGSSDEMVRSFFDIATSDEPAAVMLSGAVV